MRFPRGCSRPVSCSVSLTSSSATRKSIWSRVSSLFSSSKHRVSAATASCGSSSGKRSSDSSGVSNNDISSTINKYHATIHHNPPLDYPSLPSDQPPLFAIPPFSPTYSKDDEFPYSNFYIKLPNGDYMVRYRSGNRDILGTEIIAGHMI